MNELFSVILSLKTKGECRRFFRDLCTLEELKEFGDRWKVVQLLNEKLPYRTIAGRTGVSTTTISRIGHWLRYGQGGYRLALRRSK